MCLLLKVAEAMEIMLIAVVGPVIRCEWQLANWQVALVTTVSNLFHMCHLFSVAPAAGTAGGQMHLVIQRYMHLLKFSLPSNPTYRSNVAFWLLEAT